MDTDRLPPVLELRLLHGLWRSPAAISQRNRLKVPRVLELCGNEYEFMGLIRCEGMADNGSRLSARVVIRGRTYSFQERETKAAPLKPVDPNLFKDDWIIDIPARSLPSTGQEVNGMILPRIYYTRRKGKSHSIPLNLETGTMGSQHLPSETTGNRAERQRGLAGRKTRSHG